MPCRVIVMFLLLIAAPVALAEGPSRSWALFVDNDLFSPSPTDRDYTGGSGLSYSGPELEGNWNLPRRLLGGINRLLFDGALAREHGVDTSLEIGTYAFTPDDIERPDVVANDRPYSSLVYISTSQNYQQPGSQNSWSTSLTLGALGLSLFEAGQNAVHPITGSRDANGWRHQISDGGELTLRYSVAYHDYLPSRRPDARFKLTYFGSAGYLTEAGAALVFRDGLISSPDNRFNPELGAYGEHARISTGSTAPENYFWGGIALKVRLYNAFLEGQFRNSDHTISRSDLNPVIAEAWAGYTHSLSASYKLSYFLRIQSPEIRTGEASRVVSWGGFVLSHTFN